MGQINKATPVQMRKALEAVEHFRRAGIRFVPMPVVNETEHAAMVKLMMTRLRELEQRAEAVE